MTVPERARKRTTLRALTLAALVVFCPHRAGAETEPVVITGPRVLSIEIARSAAGTPPIDAPALQDWARGAIDRITTAYRDRGYTYARGWLGRTDKGIRIHVDEGQMRILFTGAGSVSALLFQVDLNLPHNVFNQRVVEHALEELRSKHNLLNAYYRVKEPGEVRITPFGRPVPQRVLQIYIVRRERHGWGFDLSFSATWGVLPSVSYSRKGLIVADDLFDAEVEVAFPFRRYLVDKDPKLTWVRGSLECAYRLPRWFHRRLGLRPRTVLRSSRYERNDLSLVSFYDLRSVTLAELGVYLGPVELGLGTGLSAVWILDAEQQQQQAGVPPAPDDTSLIRSLWRTYFRFRPSSEVLRRDQRSYLDLELDVLTETYQDLMLDLRIKGQLFVLLGRHRLIGRLKATLLAGQVPFFDEVALAGDHQRVFFSDRYWIHEAVQLETAYRVNLWWDWFEVGLFHDVSLFGNRSADSDELSLANAFGPSLHFLLFDTFSLAVYSGFGFAPVGFDHTFSFNVQTIF